jgi:hypothetical protein
MSMIGGDVAAIRGFVTGLRRRSQQITATTNRLTSLVDSVPWVGPDRERFVQEWQGTHRPALLDLCAGLVEAADTAARHADEQEAASAADTGAIR